MAEGKNWAPVSFLLLNRLSGLFLMSPIPEDNINSGPAKDYFVMMQNLRHRILAAPEQVSN
jgi:hypothetical protein